MNGPQSCWSLSVTHVSERAIRNSIIQIGPPLYSVSFSSSATLGERPEAKTYPTEIVLTTGLNQ